MVTCFPSHTKTPIQRLAAGLVQFRFVCDKYDKEVPSLFLLLEETMVQEIDKTRQAINQKIGGIAFLAIPVGICLTIWWPFLWRVPAMSDIDYKSTL